MTPWTSNHDRGFWHHGLYTIRRNIRDFSAWKVDGGLKLLGKADTLLEAKLLCSCDAAKVESKPRCEHNWVPLSLSPKIAAGWMGCTKCGERFDPITPQGGKS